MATLIPSSRPRAAARAYLAGSSSSSSSDSDEGPAPTVARAPRLGLGAAPSAPAHGSHADERRIAGALRKDQVSWRDYVLEEAGREGRDAEDDEDDGGSRAKGLGAVKRGGMNKVGRKMSVRDIGGRKNKGRGGGEAGEVGGGGEEKAKKFVFFLRFGRSFKRKRWDKDVVGKVVVEKAVVEKAMEVEKESSKVEVRELGWENSGEDRKEDKGLLKPSSFAPRPASSSNCEKTNGQAPPAKGPEVGKARAEVAANVESALVLGGEDDTLSHQVPATRMKRALANVGPAVTGVLPRKKKKTRSRQKNLRRDTRPKHTLPAHLTEETLKRRMARPDLETGGGAKSGAGKSGEVPFFVDRDGDGD